jgi:hypothetical protein
MYEIMTFHPCSGMSQSEEYIDVVHDPTVNRQRALEKIRRRLDGEWERVRFAPACNERGERLKGRLAIIGTRRQR